VNAGSKINAVLELLHRQREADLHTGVVIYVSQRGQTLLHDAIPDLTKDEILPWRSAGKPITAIAIATLWEQNLLDLDDTVAKHLPQFASHGKERITLRHLLIHTAGIRWAAIEKGMKWNQIIERICDAPSSPTGSPAKRPAITPTPAGSFSAKSSHD
jgi:CubicO group peptidase (beta-lactamase class C family)